MARRAELLFVGAIVLVGSVAACSGQAAPSPAAGTTSRAAAQQPNPSPDSSKVDLNTAPQADLQDLPGIDAATANRIAKGRPYSTVDDVARVGVQPATIDRIRSLVTVSASGAGSAGTVPTNSGAPPAAPANAVGETPPPTGAPRGVQMVWADPDAKTFVRRGDPRYGRTPGGRYISEAQAIKEGYRPAGPGVAR